MSHNVEEDIETKIEAEDVETGIEIEDESPIGMYINLDNTRWTLVSSLVNLCLDFVF